MATCLANGQTNILNYEIPTMWEIKPRMTPQKTSKAYVYGTVHHLYS